MDTMNLWNQVCVTDPLAVNPIIGKQYKGNSPKPYWLIQRATEVFGPVGIGWGVTVKSERFERLSDTDVLHVAVVSVWFVQDGKRSEPFEQMGGTKAAYMTGKGVLMVDDDAGKKSVTDGMVKCLSMIGFAGDIFSGQWDDSKYVEFAAQETTRRNAQLISEHRAEQIALFAADVQVNLPAMFKWLSDSAGREITAFNQLTDVEADAVTKKLKAKKATRRYTQLLDAVVLESQYQ